MNRFRWLVWLFGLGAFTAVTAAQDTTCPAIVEQVLAATEQACEATGRNQACYGNSLLEAVPQTDSSELAFRERGDLVDLALVRSLTLSPMDVEADVWGVSLMRIQANLPDTLPGQNVTMLMFGDVEVRVPTNTEPVTIDMTATGGVNVRAAPSTNASVIGGLSLGQTVTANGRLEDHSWLRIISPDDEGTYGWVFGERVATEGDLRLLAIVDPAETASTPSQAFYFRTGIGDAPCAEAPTVAF